MRLAEKECCQMIMECLLWHVVEQPDLTLNYQQLSDQMGELILARNLTPYMMKVYHLCTKLGCPPLPVIVINQGMRGPSQWLYQYYEIIHQLDEVNEGQIFRQELKQVYYYKDWDQIAKFLNVEERLIFRLKKRSEQLSCYLMRFGEAS